MAHTSCGYYVSNELAPDAVEYRRNLVKNRQIIVYLEYFIPIFVDQGEQAQTALCVRYFTEFFFGLI